MTLAIAMTAFSFAGIGKVLVFLLMLCVLVVLHEYGHFIVARRNGVRVNDFAVGFGPTLVKWTSPRSGTNYRINLLPIGGYCAMQGEDGKTNEAEQQRVFRAAANASDDNFQAKRPLQRLAIVVAGPVANFLVAIALLFGIGVAYGIPDKTAAVVGPLQAGMPAERAGLRAYDRITAVNGETVPDGTWLVEKIHASAGKTLVLTYSRGGVSSTVSVVPENSPDPTNPSKHIGLIGFRPQAEYKRVGVVEAGSDAIQEFDAMFTQTLTGLGSLVTQPSTALGKLRGPIGMARASGEVQDLGAGPYLTLAATLSVALGIFNLLPIPALDGGRAIFILFEMVRGKPVDPEKEAYVHVGGFALIISLMLVVAYHDIGNIIAGKSAL
jgi:regulator of sigma E protease